MIDAPDWRAQAACKARPEIFTAERPDVSAIGLRRNPEVREAIEVCSACPVLVDCAEWAAKIPLLDVRSMPGFVVAATAVPSRRHPLRFRQAVAVIARTGQVAVA